MENNILSPTKMFATLTLLQDILGSTYRFHEKNSINKVSPEIACESYQRNIGMALEIIDSTLKEVGYNKE